MLLPLLFFSSLLFSPSSALISSRWVESLLYNMFCALMLFIHASFSLLLPALSAA